MNTLRSRLILSYLLIIAVALLVTLVTLLVVWRNVGERLTEQRLVELDAPLFQTTILVSELIRQDASEVDIMRALREETAASRPRVLLLDAQGLVLADSRGELTRQQIAEPGTFAIAPPGLAQPWRGEFTLPGGEEVLWSALPARVRPGVSSPRVIVAVAVPKRELSALPRQFVQALLRAGLLAFILSILFALWISRSISRPLLRVAQAAEAMAQGRYAGQVAVEGPAEVQSLARSFNDMVAQVRRTQVAQHDFIANVSHDLKTPLTSIRGYAQALLDGAVKDEAARQHAAGVIHAEAGRMGRLVDDLLDLTKIDAGQGLARREAVDMAALLPGVADRFRMLADAAGVALDVRVPPSLPPVLGDGDRLAQVVSNLLDNAIRHTPAGGKVTLAAQPPAGVSGSLLEITVTDTGSGIAPEELPRLFERFYQVDKSRGEVRRGSAGLGLSIVKELTEAHGGTVAVESVVGLGSRFTVRLPVAQPAAAEPSARSHR